MSAQAIQAPNPSPVVMGHTPRRVSLAALLIGIVGLAVAGYGFYQGLLEQDSRPILSWLLGFSVWFSVQAGLLFWLLIWYVFGAGWPIIIRRQIEHALAAFPWVWIAFLPLLGVAWFYVDNPGILWKWLNLESILPGGHTVAQDPIYHEKAGFLNREFFTYRVAGYILYYTLAVWFFRKCSFSLDKTGNVAWFKRANKGAAAALPLCAFVTTFAAFDFYMSLSYHWFSTMYGVWFFATSLRASLAVMVILCYIMSVSKHGPLKGIYNQAHRYDLGSLCFAFTVFWAYITFCQYFLIYNANIPEETFWYVMRELGADWAKNSWWWVSLFGIILGYFIVPFFYLLFYPNKINQKRFLFIAIWILVFHSIDLYFNLLPGQIPAENDVGYIIRAFSITPYDIAAITGIGGICVWAFCRSLGKAAPIPLRDPRILASINHHE